MSTVTLPVSSEPRDFTPTLEARLTETMRRRYLVVAALCVSFGTAALALDSSPVSPSQTAAPSLTDSNKLRGGRTARTQDDNDSEGQEERQLGPLDTFRLAVAKLAGRDDWIPKAAQELLAEEEWRKTASVLNLLNDVERMEKLFRENKGEIDSLIQNRFFQEATNEEWMELSYMLGLYHALGRLSNAIKLPRELKHLPSEGR
uniref:Uncharacterized protein n=1 Tax=Peronospora matthiolae TaxID=2874970 RepID=A0AAV1VFE8_9STRA